MKGRTYTGQKDDDGNKVYVGDIVHFSFGIPPIGVDAPIRVIDGKNYAITKGHKPDKCLFRSLRRHVGNYYIIGNEYDSEVKMNE